MTTFYTEISPINKLKLKQLFFICAYWIILLRFIIVQNFRGSFLTTGFETTPKFFQMMQESLMLAGGAGLLMGLVTGLLDLYIIPKKLMNLSFLKINILRILVAILSMLFIGFSMISIYKFTTSYLTGLELIKSIFSVFNSFGFAYMLIVGIILSIGVNFILSVQNKIGHRSFLPLLLGKYHRPKVEERIFLFIDLKSSSFTAEKLGHIKYSQLLQQCFRLLADMVPAYYGEIYQFVGDESVISWKANHSKNHERSVALFHQFSRKLKEDSYQYYRKYGVMPQFKGAIHSGEVMAAEVGGFLKTELAFHGDVLNTTARILEQCSIPDSELLISEQVHRNIEKQHHPYHFKDKGAFKLRGKNNGIKIYNVVYSL